MTFEDFKKLAVDPPYIEQESVYRVDVHCYVESANMRENETLYNVRLTQSFIYSHVLQATNKLHRVVKDPELKDNKLYAVYIYELPIGKDISGNLYQRLWVYNHKGGMNGQSQCSAILEDLDHMSAKFRGHYAYSIRFEPGDIVEVYDRENNFVKLAVVVKQPPTIEECWEERKHVEIACRFDGIGEKYIDDNYWFYADADSYIVVDGPDFENNRSYPRTYDVFPLSRSVSPELCQRFAEYHKKAIEAMDKIQEGNELCMKQIRALFDLL